MFSKFFIKYFSHIIIYLNNIFYFTQVIKHAWFLIVILLSVHKWFNQNGLNIIKIIPA